MDVNTGAYQKGKPLTRADIERRIQEIGSTHKLDLSYQDLRGADLSYLDLTKANLDGANLSFAFLHGADLHESILGRADLRRAYLREADLHEANLNIAKLMGADLLGANLFRANLFGADLSGSDLMGANFFKANLRGANLFGANLRGANLFGADLLGVDLRGANLRRANLFRTDLRGARLDEADLTGAILPEDIESYREKTTTGSLKPISGIKLGLTTYNVTSLHLRIIEDPLTLHNLSTVLSALSELSTKCWLISKGRFADLIEYTQTHNTRFAEEAQSIVTSVTYNSPFNISMNFPPDPKNFVVAVREAIDTLTQTGLRLEQAKLETQSKAESLRQAKVKTDQEYQAKQQELEIALQKAAQDQEREKFELEKQKWALQVERDKQEFEMRRQELELKSKEVGLQKEILDLENMRITYAIEAASKIVDAQAPSIDPTAREMEIQSLVPNLLQLYSIKGLKVVLPAEGER